MIPTSPTKAKKVARPPSNHPSTLDMVLEALEALKETRGVPAPRIKSYICEKYKDIDPTSMKHRLRQALTKGMEKGLLAQTKASVDRPVLLSRFKLLKQKPVKKEKPKATDTTKKETKKKTTEKKTTDKKKTTVKKTPTKTKTVAKKPKTAKETKPKKVKTPVKKTAKPKVAKVKTAKPKVPKTPKTPKSTKKIAKT